MEIRHTGSSAAPSDQPALAAASGDNEGSAYSNESPATAVGAVLGVERYGSSRTPDWLMGIGIALELRFVCDCECTVD